MNQLMPGVSNYVFGCATCRSCVYSLFKSLLKLYLRAELATRTRPRYKNQSSVSLAVAVIVFLFLVLIIPLAEKIAHFN